jgi:adenylate cyclase
MKPRRRSLVNACPASWAVAAACSVTVSELLPPASSYPVLTDEQIAHYEEALQAFLDGQWNQAYELLHQVPPQDRGKDFLTSLIIEHDHTPPATWDGIVPLQAKNG